MSSHWLSHSNSINDRLRDIAHTSTAIAHFWSAAHGWAPKEAANLLSQARLDWLASFSRVLGLRVRELRDNPDEPATIILAWVHLRTLVEGHLKLFLTVFLKDYLEDAAAPGRKGAIIQPEDLKLEEIRQFLVKHSLLSDHHDFIATVQQRGNAIHAFTGRAIGSVTEYLEYIERYQEFLSSLNASLPCP
jgi:hypothetical protein